MSPLYTVNNKILIRDGKLATSHACCCESSSSSSSSSSSEGGGDCVGCYELNFDWVFLNNCCSPRTNLVGTLLINSNGIVCYECPEVTSSSNTDLNFENLCGEGTYSYLTTICTASSTVIFGTIDSDIPSYITDVLPVNLCCSDSGSYQINDDEGNSILYINMSLASTGVCDCGGYTNVGNP